MARIEFFFDCSSPWTYLGFDSLCRLAEDRGLAVDWKPILVGGVFNAVNPSVYAARQNPVPAKARHMLKDLQDWARHQNLKIVMPPAVFPVNSARAMRGCFLAQETGRLVPYARAVFEAYWGADRDISREEVLRELAPAAGVGADLFLERVASDDLKARLKANTDELIARNGFGSPTLFLDGDDMYFGNDRMALVAAALDRG